MRARYLSLGLMVTLAIWALAGPAAVARDLLDLVPPDAGAAAMLDFSPDSDSVRLLASMPDPHPKAGELFRQSFEKMLRGVGVNINLREDVMGALGSRGVIVVRMTPGARMPDILVLAEVKDAARVERTLRRTLGAFLRTYTLDRAERPGAVVHSWKRPSGDTLLSYGIVDGSVLVASSSSSMTDKVLATPASPDASPLREALRSAPEGIFRYAALPSMLGAPKEVPEGTIVGSTAFKQEGLVSELVVTSSDPRAQQILQMAGGLPPVTGDAMKPIVDGSLAAVALGNPGAIVEQIQKVAGDAGPLAGLKALLPSLMGLLGNDAAVALRTAVPSPSWVISIAAKDAATLKDQWAAVQTLVGSVGILTFKEGRLGDHPVQFLQTPNAKEAGPMVLAAVDRYLVIAADQRTLEESIGAIEGQEVSLADTDAFKAARAVAGGDARLVGYIDPSILVGAGMAFFQAAWMASPMGEQMAEGLSDLRSISFSVSVDGKGLRLRKLVGMSNPRALPSVMAGMGMAAMMGAGIAMPMIAQRQILSRPVPSATETQPA
ncbi:MAG TPA: DUF3352 domain-containing protein, partial [Armatimonadota bacterium]